MRAQLDASTLRPDLLQEDELREQSRAFLGALRAALASSNGSFDATAPQWGEVRSLLTEVSRARARRGFSASETATFVFSLKEPLFTRLQKKLAGDAKTLVDEIWRLSTLLDRLGLVTAETFQQSREDVIARQQQEMLELST